MIRGTATQWKLILPYQWQEIKDIRIKFWQPGNPNAVGIVKYKYNCQCTDESSNEAYVSLLPSETKLFSDKYKAKMQLSVTPNSGLPIGNQERLITVYPMQDDIIPGDPEADIPTPPADYGWVYLDGGTIISE